MPRCLPGPLQPTQSGRWSYLRQIPGGVFALGEVTLFVVLLFYGILFSWTFLGRHIKHWASQKLELENVNYLLYASITVVILGVLAGVVWRAALAAPDGKLHITLLDVGSGDGILVQTPTGRNLLIDGGPSPNMLSDALGRRLPLARRRLDFLVVAAAGEGQIGLCRGQWNASRPTRFYGRVRKPALTALESCGVCWQEIKYRIFRRRAGKV